MKKLLTFLIGVALSTLCSAQLQNGNFENWNNLSFNNPSGWFNSNGDAARQGLTPTVTQYTPAHGGSYAIKLETVSNLTDTAFGLIAHTNDLDNITGGVPYNMKPDSFFCYAKLGILAGDTGLLAVFFKNGGSPIGMNIFKITGNNNPTVWQRLAFKLSTLSMNPDTVVIIATSSNGMTKIGIQPGSFVVYDDFAFNTSLPIPYGSFENWDQTNYEIIADWDCNSALYFMTNGLGVPLQKTTDKYEGQYALKLTTMAVDLNQKFTGINNGYWDGNAMRFRRGFSFATQVDTLIGWYKYAPKTIDSAQINIEFRKAGAPLGQYSTWLPAQSSYTKFELPFSLSLEPDTAVITINSSNWPFTLSDTGSVLIIDALKFRSNLYVGVQNFFTNASVLIGPNPTSGEFSMFYIPKNVGKASYTLCDETGKVVKSEMLNGIKTTINISGFPKGIYFVKIVDGKSIISKKLVLQ